MTEERIRSCEEALRVLAAYLDGELDAGSGERLEEHLATCRSCYSRSEFERRLKARLAALARESVPPELSRRVSTLMGQFTVAPTDQT